MKRTVQRIVKRGRIDISINKEAEEGDVLFGALNHSAVKAYMQAASDLTDRYGVEGSLSVRDMLTLPNILIPPDHLPANAEDDMEGWGAFLQEGLEQALERLVFMRSTEGSHLLQDVEQRLHHLQALHGEMVSLSPTVVKDYRLKLKQRLSDLKDHSFVFDEHKFGMEIAIFADRSNIDEELVRLQSHFKQCMGLLQSNEPIGRKLDFLIQEMNREVNTIGSKANHLTLITRVVEMKAELEKIREQAANIE